jgi:hypothetical protein
MTIVTFKSPHKQSPMFLGHLKGFRSLNREKNRFQQLGTRKRASVLMWLSLLKSQYLGNLYAPCRLRICTERGHIATEFLNHNFFSLHDPFTNTSPVGNKFTPAETRVECWAVIESGPTSRRTNQ